MFSNIKYPEGHNFEDIATTYKIINKANRVGILNEYLYHYRQRPDSLMHDYSTSTVLDSIIAREQLYKFIKNNYPELSNISYNALVFNYLQYAVCAYKENKINDNLKKIGDSLRSVNIHNLQLSKKAFIMLYLFRKHLLLFKLISKLTR